MQDTAIPDKPRITLDQAEAYLGKKAQSELIGNLIGAILSLAGAALVFFVFAVFSVMLLANFSLPNLHAWPWLALAIMGFAFVAHAFTDPEHLSRLKVETVDGRPAYTIWLPGGWRISNVNLLSPATSRSLARIVLQFMISGPRAIISTWRYARRAQALRKVELSTLAPMLTALAVSGRRIPYDELAPHAPRDPAKAFADLLLLDAVQPLLNQPQGLVITSKCREELTGIKPDGTDF